MRTIIVTTAENKMRLLKQYSTRKELFDIKIMTTLEFQNRFYFDYDKRAVYYLATKENCKAENAKLYLDHMIYLTDKNYKHPKLRKLKQQKEELEKEGLLIYDPLFKSFLKNKKVVFDLPIYDAFLKRMIKEVGELCEVCIENSIHTKETYDHVCYAFSSHMQEIDFVAEEICKLHEVGIPYANIKLVNVTSDIASVVKRVFAWYHIPISHVDHNFLYGSVIASYFLTQLGCMPVSEIIDSMRQTFRKPEDQVMINQIVDIVNTYHWYDGDASALKPFYMMDFKNTECREMRYHDAVEVTTFENTQEEDYVFFIQCNSELVPHVLKDECFINNQMAEELDYSDTKQKNALVSAITRKKISTHKNLTITYTAQNGKEEYYPSSILAEMDIPVITKEEDQKMISYSSRASEMKLGRLYDLFYQYGEKNPCMGSLIATFPDLAYRTYQHKYQKIPKEMLHHYFKAHTPLVLSYTNMNKYIQCAFRYYLDQVLHLDPYEETFSAMIGSYYHHILECARKDDFDLHEETNAFFKDQSLTFKERFLLKRLEKELENTVAFVLKQEKSSQFKTLYFEKKLTVSYDYSIPVVMKGFIDKIMEYQDGDHRYFSVIDYKTGNFQISLKEMKYGFHLQLPVYAYLLKMSPEFQDGMVTGLYISPILVSKNLSTIPSNTAIYKEMRLIGYSTDDASILEKFDPTYQNSTMIRGMSRTKNGFGAYSRVLTRQAFDDLIALVDDRIHDTITHILNGDFDINPKILNGKNQSCSYCPYRDICYHDYTDEVYLSTTESRGGE